MINAAMFASRNDLNEFTAHLKSECEIVGSILVRLRNDTMVMVQFTPENEEDCVSAGFHTANWSMCWNLDGSSVTSRDFDIVSCG